MVTDEPTGELETMSSRPVHFTLKSLMVVAGAFGAVGSTIVVVALFVLRLMFYPLPDGQKNRYDIDENAKDIGTVKKIAAESLKEVRRVSRRQIMNARSSVREDMPPLPAANELDLGDFEFDD